MKQGLNEADHRFLTFFACFPFRLGNAQSELKGEKFQRLVRFVFRGLAVAFGEGWKVAKLALPGRSFAPIHARYCLAIREWLAGPPEKGLGYHPGRSFERNSSGSGAIWDLRGAQR
jgi:hypothetical protein